MLEETLGREIIWSLWHCFQKANLWKCFASTIKQKADKKGDLGSEVIARADDFVSKRITCSQAVFFWNECRGERVRSQVMKGLALTSQVNLFVCFNCSYSILILSSFFAFPCSSSCFCLISAYFQIIILNRYSNVTERESIHCWQRQVTTVWCSVIEHLCDIIIELRIL